VAESFLLLPDADKKDILDAAAEKLGRSGNVLEKDVWLCWALEELWRTPGAVQMAFKGGTSLSKVYGVIDRFSEDIDVTVDHRKLGPELDPFILGI
jgi:predicted nucleotidyltransferase component of viral defense system